MACGRADRISALTVLSRYRSSQLHEPQSTQTSKPSIRLVALASLIGTTIEWYDFFLYNTAAALVFNKLFFPTSIRSWARCWRSAPTPSGFAARPVGAIVIGHYGDKVGRRSMLVLTLMMMGIATVCDRPAADLRDASASWAAVLLVLLRLVQGFGVGGQWGGAVLMAVEHAPAGQARLLRQLAADRRAGRAADLYDRLPAVSRSCRPISSWRGAGACRFS